MIFNLQESREVAGLRSVFVLMLLTVSVVVWSSPAVAQLPAAVTTQELLPGPTAPIYTQAAKGGSGTNFTGGNSLCTSVGITRPMNPVERLN
jgi:hypothetical protein